MRRYIDADKLKEMVNRQYSYCHGYHGTKKDIYREALLAVKSAIHCQSVSKDMQEVVRCKDCKYKGWVQEPCHGKSTDYCRVWDSLLINLETTFCSYGERNESNE